MNKADKYYKENLIKLNTFGSLDENPRPKYKDETPAYTKFITQVYEEYDISNNEFPIPTLRNTAIKTAIKEIFWIYQKQTSSLEDAHSLGINWWDEWNIGDNTIGIRYGETIKRYDLMNKLLKGLIDDPFGRRHIISLWQENDFLESKGLNPCAFQTLWSVRRYNNELYLDCTLTQRSSDYIMAGYINKIQYVALQMMVAGHCGYKVGKFSHFVQNLHYYDRHQNAINELIERTPLNIQPLLFLKENKNFYNYTLEDFQIKNTENIQKLKSPLEIAI